MNRLVTASDDYLIRLANCLDALGPVETTEILAEIRSHIVQAQAEADGDEQTALARLGGPEALAKRLLEERGVIVGDSTLPEAPGWRRRMALAIDVAVTLFAFCLAFCCCFLGSSVLFADGPRFSLKAVLALCVGVLFLTWITWRWTRQRRPGSGTVGLSVMGLQRIRVEHTTRLVRRSHVPGSRQGPACRFLWATQALSTLVVFASLGLIICVTAVILAQQTRDGQDRALADGVSYSIDSVGHVSRVYQQLMAGASAEDLASSFAPEARDACADLVARYAAGEVASYEIKFIELVNWQWPEPTPDGDHQRCESQINLFVNEYAPGSELGITCKYTLTRTAKWTGQGNWERATMITRVTLKENHPIGMERPLGRKRSS